MKLYHLPSTPAAASPSPTPDDIHGSRLEAPPGPHGANWSHSAGRGKGQYLFSQDSNAPAFSHSLLLLSPHPVPVLLFSESPPVSSFAHLSALRCYIRDLVARGVQIDSVRTRPCAIEEHHTTHDARLGTIARRIRCAAPVMIIVGVPRAMEERRRSMGVNPPTICPRGYVRPRVVARCAPCAPWMRIRESDQDWSCKSA